MIGWHAAHEDTDRAPSFADEVAGILAVASLEDIDRPVDLVDAFRPATVAHAAAREAAAIGAGALWLQLGIASTQAWSIAREHGMGFVQDQCVSPIAVRFDVSLPPG